jgi:hypothetical protein
MSFSEIVSRLIETGVEYYHVDYVARRKTFYGAEGDAGRHIDFLRRTGSRGGRLRCRQRSCRNPGQPALSRLLPAVQWRPACRAAQSREALPLSDAEKNRIWVLLVRDRDNALTEVDWIIYTASCGPTSRSVTRSTKASCVGIRN